MIFTFGAGHTCVCGRPLDNCYTVFEEHDGLPARAWMFKYWGTKWSHEYPPEGLEKLKADWGVQFVPTNEVDPDSCPCGDLKLAAAGSPEALEYERWASSLEPEMRETARKYPLPWCWRSTDNPLWHFKIHSYAHDPATGAITCMLIHGADSTMPGVGTFGQRLEQLIPCRCGKWAPPSKEQTAATRAELEAQYGKLQDCKPGCDHDHHT